MNDFKDIVGYEKLINHLQNAIRMKKVSHAYIIEGEEGMGKKMLARAFAKTLQCEAGGVSPCNSCISCRLMDTSNHPDIKNIIASKKTGIGVDEIRDEINMDIYIKPYQNPYKIYIIHQADLMTNQAQNALLKTMEEPPEYGILFLLAENSSRFLPTVLSRCVMLTLKEIDENTIKNYLIHNENVSQGQADVYAAFARGNIGKAKMLMESNEFDEMRKDIIKAIDYVIEKKEFEIFEIAARLTEYKDQGMVLLDLMTTWMRDLLMVKEIKDEDYMIHKDMYKTLLKQGQHISYNRISHILKGIDEAKKNLRVNVSYQLSIETILLDIY